MIISEVKKMGLKARLIYWILERQRIYVRRRSGVPKPWTDDEILQNYRFCNVRRCDDKVTRWLIDNWYTPYKDHPNIILAATLARQLNNIPTFEAIGFPDKWEPEKLLDLLNNRAAQGHNNYSPAYVITGNYEPGEVDRENKPHQTIYRVCQQIITDPPPVDTTSMFRTWRSMLGLTGFGSFIAGQVVADLRWAMSGTWSDKDSWAPAGPGSKRGMNRYHGRKINHSMSQEQFLRELTTLFDEFKRNPKLPHLEMMDFQGCMCEYDKYERTLAGEGKPRQRYQGVPESDLIKLTERRIRVSSLQSKKCVTIKSPHFEIHYDPEVSPGMAFLASQISVHLEQIYPQLFAEQGGIHSGKLGPLLVELTNGNVTEGDTVGEVPSNPTVDKGASTDDQGKGTTVKSGWKADVLHQGKAPSIPTQKKGT